MNTEQDVKQKTLKIRLEIYWISIDERKSNQRKIDKRSIMCQTTNRESCKKKNRKKMKIVLTGVP